MEENLHTLLTDATKLRDLIAGNSADPQIVGVAADVRLATRLLQRQPELSRKLRATAYSLGRAADFILTCPDPAVCRSVLPALQDDCEALDDWLRKRGPRLDPDGPNHAENLRWLGRDYHVPPIPWRVLKAMWGTPRMPQDALEAFVWGAGVETTPSALKAAVHRANAVLLEAGYGRWLHIGAGEIFWSDPEVSGNVTV